MPGSAADAVDMALRLASCEPLIRALEDWLALPLDPEPLAAGLPASAGAAGTLLAESLAPPGVAVHLPWGLILRSAAPPRVLLGSPWTALWCEVELAHFTSAPGSRERVRTGVVLLPGSFGSHWHVKLADAHQGLALTAECVLADGVLKGFQAARQAAANAAPEAWRVVLAECVTVPLPVALGWQGGSVPLPSCRARLCGPGAPPVWAEGSVCPAWDGAALSARSLC